MIMKFNHPKLRLKKYLIDKIIGKVVKPPMTCERHEDDGLQYCRSPAGKTIFLFDINSSMVGVLKRTFLSLLILFK